MSEGTRDGLVREGWLWKRPVTANRGWRWKRRFVCLYGDRLTIHRQAKPCLYGASPAATIRMVSGGTHATFEAVQVQPSRELHLDSNSLLRHPGPPRRFCIVSGGAMLQLQAADAAEAQAWVSSLHWSLSAATSCVAPAEVWTEAEPPAAAGPVPPPWTSAGAEEAEVEVEVLFADAGADAELQACSAGEEARGVEDEDGDGAAAPSPPVPRAMSGEQSPAAAGVEEARGPKEGGGGGGGGGDSSGGGSGGHMGGWRG